MELETKEYKLVEHKCKDGKFRFSEAQEFIKILEEGITIKCLGVPGGCGS